MRYRFSLASCALVGGLLVHGGTAIVHAQETPQGSTSDLLEEDHHATRSIVDELANGVALLTQAIAKEQQNLQSAQTDRERQLIQDHLTFLNDQQHSLTELLDLLVGPHFDTRQAAREQRQDLQYERTQQQLERDERRK